MPVVAAPQPTLPPPTATTSAALLAEIDAALAEPDRIACNRAVTAAHHHLAVALDHHLGDRSGDVGATFHAWATWGSHEAGRTVAKRDVAHLPAAGGAVAGLTGSAAGWAAGGALTALVGGLLAATLVAAALRAGLERASAAIATGNRIVLDDIGRVSARLLDVDHDADLAALVASLAPEQAALGPAMALYHRARHEPDRRHRHQLAFAATCLALRHEHVRLQPWIARALMPGTRRLFTATLLRYRIGDERLHVGREVPPFAGAQWAPTLDGLDLDEVAAVAATMRRPGRRRTAASDWTVYDQRMHHAVALFRSRHLDPALLDDPDA